MRCRFCGCDPELIILVPAKGKEGGALETFACYDCAVEKGLYCEKHERPHTGFLGDDSTACLHCIEEEVQAKKDTAEEVYDRLRKELPQKEWDDLQEAAEMSSTITGDDEPVSALRFIVTRAHRLHLSSEEVTAKLLELRSVMMILSSSQF